MPIGLANRHRVALVANAGKRRTIHLSAVLFLQRSSVFFADRDRVATIADTFEGRTIDVGLVGLEQCFLVVEAHRDCRARAAFAFERSAVGLGPVGVDESFVVFADRATLGDTLATREFAHRGIDAIDIAFTRGRAPTGRKVANIRRAVRSVNGVAAGSKPVAHPANRAILNACAHFGRGRAACSGREEATLAIPIALAIATAR